MEREDLEDLIQNFGIAVLGKDQESADDVQPTADHSHVNIKVDKYVNTDQPNILYILPDFLGYIFLSIYFRP